MSYLQRFQQAKHNEEYFTKNTAKKTFEGLVQQIISHGSNQLCAIRNELNSRTTTVNETVIESYENHNYEHLALSGERHYDAEKELVETLLSYYNFLDEFFDECAKEACKIISH